MEESQQSSTTATSAAFVKSHRLGISSLSEHLGKLPPQAVEIEEAVLGALMLERDALSNVIDILHPESFYRDANQEI